MLDVDSILFLPEYMYINVGKKEIYYAYLPDNNKTFGEMLKELFEYILEHYEHGKEKDNVMRVYEIYQKVINEEYNIYHFSSLVQEQDAAEYTEHGQDSKKEIIVEEIPKEEIVSEEEQADAFKLKAVKLISAGVTVLMAAAAVSLFFPEKSLLQMSVPICIAVLLAGSASLVQLMKHKKRLQSVGTVIETVREKAYTLKNDIEYDRADYNEANEIHDISEVENEPPIMTDSKENVENTILLSDYLKQKKNPSELKLYYQNTSDSQTYEEDINISRFPCVIGSLAAYCNVVIQSELISRMHICIYQEENGYYIEDMNSTNGTFVNDKQILPQQKHFLENGDVLRLANLVYKVEKS